MWLCFDGSLGFQQLGDRKPTSDGDADNDVDVIIGAIKGNMAQIEKGLKLWGP
ncbi:hypothetical protein DsansV1_C27g0202681 [Dioscorea sansibarensis]